MNNNEEHKKIQELLLAKITALGNQGNPKELEKFNALYRLVSNEYHPFFSKLDIGMAYSILEDIGVSKEDISSVYTKLMREEIQKKYVFLDPNSKKLG